MPYIILVIRNVSENWIRVNSFKFMIEISNFIRSFKKKNDKLLKSFSKYTPLFSREVCRLPLICLLKGHRILAESSCCRSRQMQRLFLGPSAWKTHVLGDLLCITLAIIPLSINFNSTNKKLNKSGIMSSVVFCERSVVKKAESDIL